MGWGRNGRRRSGRRREGVCKYCGAPIVWGELRGKPHPLEAQTVMLFTDSGGIASGRLSHFETCPRGEKWRSSRRVQELPPDVDEVEEKPMNVVPLLGRE